jgi:hypothetical protein
MIWVTRWDAGRVEIRLRSFDFATASLREVVATLRMTRD